MSLDDTRVRTRGRAVAEVAESQVAVEDDEGDVQRELGRIADAHGRLDPEDVVRAAADDDSPLHARFEWDDTRAGHLYRLEQARALIRSVHIPVEVGRTVLVCPVYLQDPERKRGYRALTELRTEPENARAVMRLEVSRIAGCLARAEALAKALKLEREVAAVARRLDALRERLK